MDDHREPAITVPLERTAETRGRYNFLSTPSNRICRIEVVGTSRDRPLRSLGEGLLRNNGGGDSGAGFHRRDSDRAIRRVDTRRLDGRVILRQAQDEARPW